MNYVASLIWLVLSLTIRSATSQRIDGCSTFNCPRDSYGTSTFCPLGNITASVIGTTNFTTDLLPSTPFTWTTTFSPNHPPNLKNTSALYQRGYYLGVPNSFNANTIFANAMGCALFFDGISSKLRFPAFNDSQISEGTCEDALSVGCVADLQMQVRIFLESYTASMGAGSAMCNDLSLALQSRLPTSCKHLNGNSWGEVHARGKLLALFLSLFRHTLSHHVSIVRKASR